MSKETRSKNLLIICQYCGAETTANPIKKGYHATTKKDREKTEGS